jgi:hypothetical protein
MRHGESSSHRRASSNALLDVAGTDSCSAFAPGTFSGVRLRLTSAAAAPNFSDAVKVYLYSFVLPAGLISPRITKSDRKSDSDHEAMG